MQANEHQPNLDSSRVESIFRDCLFRDGEDTSKHVRAEGITCSVGLHPERLQSHRNEIIGMLEELPNNFHERTGGGWSFLNACQDRNGRQWTGLHLRMEQLFQLGIAVGRVKCLLPRQLWSFLPGGMPYYVVLASEAGSGTPTPVPPESPDGPK